MRPDTFLPLDGELSFRLPVGVKRPPSGYAKMGSIGSVGRSVRRRRRHSRPYFGGKRESALSLPAMDAVGGKEGQADRQADRPTD